MKTRTFIAADLATHAQTIATTRPLIYHRACLWAGFLAFATIAFGPRPAQAAVTEAWVHRFSNVVSNVTDEAVMVVRDAAGDVIVTGSTGGVLPGAADMLTIKYSGADGSVLWQHRYNSPENGYDRPSALAVDGNGNVVVTGSSDDLGEGTESYTAKYAAADGTLLWEKRYSNGRANAVAVDGSGNVVVTRFSADDSFNSYTAKYAAADGALLWEQRNVSFAEAVAVDGNGNVVVTGSTGSHVFTAKYAAADGALLWVMFGKASGSQPDAAVDGGGNVVVTCNDYTAKYAAADGTLLWEKRYSNGLGTAVTVDGSGNVVVTGTVGTDPNWDYYTAKYAAADGALLWEKRYDGPASSYDYAFAVAVDGSGNVVVTGSSYGTNSNFDYYTAKYAAADGGLLWEKRYNGPADIADIAKAVTVDGSGNVVVTGQTDAIAGMGTTGGDYYTAKHAAADGALLWEQRYTGSVPTDAFAQAVAVDGSGNVVVTGRAYNWDGFQISDIDSYTAKYAAASGALLWEKRCSNGQATAVAVDGSGNVVVTGSSGDDYYTAKYAAADGTLLWEKRYSHGQATAVAVDGSGNVVVTGYSDADYYTAKYAGADGALLWEKRYDGPASSYDYALAVAVDGDGNVAVTGLSFAFRSSTNHDYYTAKYAAADGTLLWEKRYNGTGNGADGAGAVAVDGSGNVVVTGSSYGTNSNFDYYTAKYAAADGGLLWEKRYNGSPNSFARAVAVDGSGNVVVTGSSDGTNSNSDYYTAKYAASDGALLWEKRYNGPANSGDYAGGVAVDGSGNVVVTGTSTSGFDSFGNPISDYYTAKYAAADGALLWEKRFTGPASIGDSSHCLALGPDGMVAVTGTSNGGYATVVYREVAAVSIDLIPTGVRLRVTGLPGRSYHIERASAVTGPWSTINTQTAPGSGLFEYLDTNPPAPAGFYRTHD